MYVAPHFRPRSSAEAMAIVRAHPFGLLVSQQDGRPIASHTPMLPDGDDHLIGHVARANPQWRGLEGQEVLAVFSGPHAHVTPTWYKAAPAVPTWDYVAAHVYGRAELVEDAAGAADILRRLTAEFEGESWRFDDQPERFLATMIKGLVAFRLRITQVEASFKLSQNRSAADRAGVIEGLRDRDLPGDAAISDLIEVREREKQGA
ncbi:MAG: FMN-binding negative transcriptional regulator [Geminicoccaceae bacterium]|nr:FMN-binding negative transcriptional regulator [Geminicoccaceae bacterium]